MQAQFDGVQTDFKYWSSTVIGPSDAFTFSTIDGDSSTTDWRSAIKAVAVRPGDVAAPVPVPEPQTLALALLALGAIVVVRRTRPA